MRLQFIFVGMLLFTGIVLEAGANVKSTGENEFSLVSFMRNTKLDAEICPSPKGVRLFLAQSSTPYGAVYDPNEFDNFVLLDDESSGNVLMSQFDMSQHMSWRQSEVSGWAGINSYNTKEIPDIDAMTGLNAVRHDFAVSNPVTGFSVYKDIETGDMTYCYTFRMYRDIYSQYTYDTKTGGVNDVFANTAGWFDIRVFPRKPSTSLSVVPSSVSAALGK